MSALDLDAALRALRSVAADLPPTPLPPLRQADPLPARLPDDLNAEPIQPSTAPLPVAAWIDGIQSETVVCWARHRPILAQYVAAVAIDASGDVLDKVESAAITCSDADAAWVHAVVPEQWTNVVADGDETTIRTAARAIQQSRRWSAERTLSKRILDRVEGIVVVDGQLTAHTTSRRLVGVVKSHPGAYVTPEWHLHDLGEGEITAPAFEILDRETEAPTGRKGATSGSTTTGDAV